ncbi:MAG: glycoside hydrolase [Frankiales bacterium]|jgi:cell wall-associated NlpC family hydrolase|nr:glycoside hydrolase [Frankiales bacterium]MCW2584749.1 glycoside hydrolase [Frankiales bacterium]
MFTSPPAPARSRRKRLIAAVLTATALTAGGLVTAAPADAATVGQKAVAEAKRHTGKPYQYGAAGPSRFDCSGYTLYVFKRLGRSLPHNAAQQYGARGVRKLAKSQKAVGDLLFMKNSGGRITHVGIYAGSNRWYVAPKAGDKVKLQTLYSSNYLVGRVA